jgi:hypothetical protein
MRHSYSEHRDKSYISTKLNISHIPFVFPFGLRVAPLAVGSHCGVQTLLSFVFVTLSIFLYKDISNYIAL